MKFEKITKLALACIAPFALSGCLILPGEFTSEMTILKSGEFKFSYKGQIQLLGLANLLNHSLDAANETAEFKATCWKDNETAEAETTAEPEEKAKKSGAESKKINDDTALQSVGGDTQGSAASATAVEDPDLAAEASTTGDDAASAAADAAAAAADAAAAATEDWSMEERECTAEEIADQKKSWDEDRAEKKKLEEQQKKMFAALIGGIDPKDPETIKRFTKEVERLAAWNKVEHLGNGVFLIDYSTTGHLGDDFAFPVIPRYAIGEPMIHVTRWDNGRVRMEAPAFHNDPDLSVMAMLGAGSMMGAMGMGKEDAPPEPIKVKGTFTLTTDANILANNTEEGPEEAGGMQILRWDIGPETYGAPMALLKLVK